MATSKAIRDFLTMIGRKGGLTASKTLTAEQRREVARTAARARWVKWRKEHPEKKRKETLGRE